MNPLLALICIFGGAFEPKGWAFCAGQIMSIAQNTALFSLLGTTYGGNGQVNFGLPDLRGRVPVGYGQFAGGTYYELGQTGGAETVSLNTGNLPLHNHPVDANLVITPSASTAAGTTNIPGPTLVPAVLPTIGGGPSAVALKGYAVRNDSTSLAPATVSGSVGFAGGSQPFDNHSPYMAVNYIIALMGIFPTRN
jgi:microcystin-dependent protein